MSIVHLRCERGHKIAIEAARPTGLLKLCKAGKRVCPHCKPDNIKLSQYTPNSDPGFINDKEYACKHGHITSLSPFTNGYISIGWGDEYENVPGVPADVPSWISSGEVKCRHQTIDSAGRKRKCGCKIKAIDDSTLSYPEGFGIKTRTRVGDIWEKEACPEARESHHEVFQRHGETDAKYVETEFSKRNKLRLKKIRKNRRQTKPVGDVLNKPTDESSGERISKDRVFRESRKDYD